VPAIPIGARATSAFLRQVVEAIGADSEKAERFIAREEREYYHYLRDFTHFYAGCTSQYRLPSEVNVISESAYALAITRFMVADLGLNPGVVVITENPPEAERETIRAAFRDLAPGIDVDPVFQPDGRLAQEAILAKPRVGEYPIVFGATWEATLAGQLSAPLVEISYPATDEVVLARSYVGYRGALQLIERTYTTVVRQTTEENPEIAAL
jgi:nitrogenase molybdenum-iron protein beta chain